MKGSTTIYQGALVALDADGYAIPGKKAENLTAVGRAEETVANAGADGELVVRVARGVFVFDNTATSANKITAAHVLKPCYMEDDHTVTALATDTSVLASSSAWTMRASPSSVAAIFPSPRRHGHRRLIE